METFVTDGSGFWTKKTKTVNCDLIKVYFVEDEDGCNGELRLLFDEATWNVKDDGFIYTDKLFLQGFRNYLNGLGLGRDIEYSEYGMQGKNFVSFDVEKDFIKSWQDLGYEDQLEI